MDIDVILEPDLSPSQIRDLGQLAEQFGFRAVWAQNYSSARDAFISLVPLAQQTKTIRIGVVIVCPYEMHPIKISNAILSLNEFAQGRAMLVIGSGGEWPEVMESRIHGTSYAHRMHDIREALEIVMLAVSSEEFTYRGSSYSALRYSARWHAESQPIIYHGACGRRMIEMGAKRADGIMLSDVMPAMLEPRLAAMKETLLKGTARGEPFRLSNFIAWHVRQDRELALAEARRELILRGWLERDWLEPYLSHEETEAVLENRWPFLEAWLGRHGNINSVPKHVIARLVEQLSLTGDYRDIDRHIERLQQFADAGFTEIALRIHEKPDESIRLIGERVVPAFKS
jgi:alkanesulfonate monooxygenase SsuD/methylene tetrahydromethanopterin reductase-like flavin-dependent oxidoreductase (luciferase family)